MGKAFWLGMIGGFLGFVGAIIAVLVGGISAAYSTSSQSTVLYGLGLSAFIFSIVGVIGGVFERKRLIGGLLMLIAAVAVLVSISLFGVLPFLFFLVGAIVIFARKTEHEVVSHQPSVAHSESFAAAQETPLYTSASSTSDGTSLSSTSSYTVCGRCGKKLVPKAKFCSGCGMSII
ncbi:MAG: zinc ribbon domain-containing protein [Halobacteriota archaeon]